MSRGLFWLSDEQWAAIEPFMPRNQPGARRKDDRRIISGIFHVLKSGCRWQDCPEEYAPPTTVYNRFNRWRKAGVWDRLMDAITAAYDGDVQMIDSSSIRVHQHAAGAKKTVEFVIWAAPEAG